ncbi:alpha/beta hydrolase [Nocardioides ginsengisoli]|uniref:Alpha/beta hydrolase n=1 Tax=Nocardioides ginsengisoli TaxID=363868 RepID=A0ABW3W7Q4_9ACTN
MKRPLTILASLAVGAAVMVPAASSTASPTPARGPAPAAAPTASTASTAAAGGGYTAPPLQWGACASQRLQDEGAQCAMLEVPLDYAKPHGRKIHIAVSRVLHTDPDYKGMMVVNPGGPGGSGLIYSIFGQFVPNGVGAKFDWYGFDPRGVGSSEPALSCNPDYKGAGFNRPNYVPTKPWIMKWWRKVTRGYARDCGKSAARRILPHMRTVDVAQDLNTLRRTVGQKKLNYYGFSYGTYLGQVYATKYPKHVGRFVWDGVLNAKNAFYKANVEQNIQFDRNINVYFRWLAKNDAVYHLGTNGDAIRKGYYKLRRKLDRHPAAGGKLGPDELDDVMLSAAYYVYGWADIGAAYTKLVKTGDGADILAMYAGPGDDNGFAVYNGVQCTDAKWPGWQKTKADSWRVYRQHPFLTWGNTWYNAPCLTWPAPSHRAFKASGKRVHAKILMVAETRDAATVFSGALATRKLFPSSFLIEGVGGTTHAGSLSGVACTDDTIATYLDTGKLPARKSGNRSDKKCPPVPPPAASMRARGGFAGVSSDRLPADLRALLEQVQMIGR